LPAAVFTAVFDKIQSVSGFNQVVKVHIRADDGNAFKSGGFAGVPAGTAPDV
jgi:hypothetical protein